MCVSRSHISNVFFDILVRIWLIFSVGVQWSNIGQPVSASDPMSMMSLFNMLILDSIIYYALARYIDLVNPGTWGIPRPWYFVFQPSYWKEYFNISNPSVNTKTRLATGKLKVSKILKNIVNSKTKINRSNIFLFSTSRCPRKNFSFLASLFNGYLFFSIFETLTTVKWV